LFSRTGDILTGGGLIFSSNKIGKWEPGRWYHVRIRLDRLEPQTVYDVYLDIDGLMHKYRGVFGFWGHDDLGREKDLDILFMADLIPCYFDNIKIYSSKKQVFPIAEKD